MNEDGSTILKTDHTDKGLECKLLDEEVPPGPQLMESMRAVGYTLDTAVADLIDNSITAGAERIQIFFNPELPEYLALIDDGSGMGENEVRDAMKLAGQSARDSRRAGDLGRFGLGLKTASLSQCRDLTVVSKHDGSTTAFRWNLDHLAATGRWSLIKLSVQEVQNLPRISELQSCTTGTMVLWRELDHISGTAGHTQRSLEESIIQVKRHLSLVFHRFLSGEHGRTLSIEVNRDPVETVDPFLRAHRSTQIGPRESFYIEDAQVEVQSYTLPLLKKLSNKDRKRANITGTLRDSQGFYIYRGMRLVIWGTWFRIVPKNDLGKLARVRVDIPNTLDHLWALDIKKSAAVPPPAVRTQLRRVADQMIEPSRRVHKYRGRTSSSGSKITHAWNVIEDRDNFRYEINRSHPLIQMVGSGLSAKQILDIEQLLVLIEESFPLDDAYNRLSGDQTRVEDRSGSEDELLQLGRSFWNLWRADNKSATEFIGTFQYVEPFSNSSNPQTLLQEVVSHE